MPDNTLPQFKKIQPNLQKAFEKHAREAGWPEDVAKQVKVELQGDKLYLRYNESLKSQIDDLEYGNQAIKPRPAIRKFTANIDKQLGNAAADKVLETIKRLL